MTDYRAASPSSFPQTLPVGQKFNYRPDIKTRQMVFMKKLKKSSGGKKQKNKRLGSKFVREN